MARKKAKRKYTRRPRDGVYGRSPGLVGLQRLGLIKGETPKPTLDRKALGEHVASLISNERNETHGDPHVQFDCAQAYKSIMRSFRSDTSFRSKLDSVHIEALEMILTKISRLTCGSNLQDAWLDIAGYALIAAEKAEKPL